MFLFNLNAQTPPTRTAENTTAVPLTVDGSVHPELIPDELAYRHFLMSVAFKRTLTPQETAHREAKIHRIGLTPADHDLLIAAVVGLRESLDAAYSMMTASKDSVSYETAKTQYANALAAAKTRLATLSPSGQKTLDDFIQTYFKTLIKIYSAPMM